MSAARWEHFAHEADMGVRGVGPSKEEAFAQAALAMTAIVTDSAKVEPKTKVSIECEAPDDELLFVDWLNAVIYEMSTQKMLFSRFEVHLDKSRLTAAAWGEKADVKHHEPAVEIKGATYTALRVKLENGQWTAQTVVDV